MADKPVLVNLDFGGARRIKGLPAPAASDEAANKSYADALGYQIGDVVETFRTLTLAAGFAVTDGAAYLKATYPIAGAVLPAAVNVVSGWTSRTSGAGANIVLEAVTLNGLVFLCGQSGLLAKSTDGGQNFTAQTIGFGANAVRGICRVNGIYVVFGDGGKYATSPDAVTWTAGTLAGGQGFIAGASSGTVLVAALSDSTFVYTADGATWTAATGSSANVKDIAFGNGMFVAVGTSGKLVTAGATGTAWTVQTAISSNHFNAICYGGGRWVAAGDNGALYTSTVGAGSWSAGTSSFGTTAIQGLHHDGSKFVAAGASSKVASAADGLAWAQLTNTGISANLYCVTSVSGTIVVAGSSGFAGTSNYSASTTEFAVPVIAARAAGLNVYVRIA